MNRPLISVIVPFGDPRGDPRYVKTWTRSQTCSPGDFEVIVVTDWKSGDLDEQIRLQLRDSDRLIHHYGHDRFAGYDYGAKAAAAPLLLLTEDHCVADPHCLEEVLRSQRAEAWQAAMLHSGHISRTDLARAEEQLYEEMFERYWSKPDYWNRVHLRGFAVQREHYFAAGGLPGQYSLFAESLFAARLYKSGVRTTYLPRAVVRHVGLITFRQMRHEVWVLLENARFTTTTTLRRWQSISNHRLTSPNVTPGRPTSRGAPCLRFAPSPGANCNQDGFSISGCSVGNL